MNFEAAVKEFLAQDALVQLPKLDEKEVVEKLADALLRLLSDAETRKNLAENASTVMRKNRGATTKTVDQLTAYFTIREIYDFPLLLFRRISGFSRLQVSARRNRFSKFFQTRNCQTEIEFYAVCFDNRAVSRAGRRFGIEFNRAFSARFPRL
jgi:hypothetical protein